MQERWKLTASDRRPEIERNLAITSACGTSGKPRAFVSATCVLIIFYEIGFFILIDNEFYKLKKSR